MIMFEVIRLNPVSMVGNIAKKLYKYNNNDEINMILAENN